MTMGGACSAAGTPRSVSMPSPPPPQNGQPQEARTAAFISDAGGLKGPRQPIFFRHDVHAGQDRIPCLYCHSSVAVSSEPGIPAVETCFGCHQLITGSTDEHKAEIKKVQHAWIGKQPPQWIQGQTLPRFDRFHH